jgi:outer membrane protein OmpA-like peptidoglycan-associated protein
MFKKVILSVMTVVMFAACAQDPYTGETGVSKTGWGAMTGASAGALAGLIGGGKNKGKNALKLAAVGGILGAGVGAYMDNQDAELRKQLQGSGVSVTKNRDGSITLNMPGDISFDTNVASVKADFYPVLNSVAKVLVKFDKTAVSIAGHADASGDKTKNLVLSQRRAESVSAYLANQGVDEARLNSQGFGSNNPIDSNSTSSGRARNRRVEIRIVATGS